MASNRITKKDITSEKFWERVKSRCEEDFSFFVRFAFKELTGKQFIVSQHHQLIIDALMSVWRGETKYLIINIPPRYGKTELAIKLFSAWCFLKNPSCKFIHLSYSSDLALDNSRAVKETLLSAIFQRFWKIELTKTSDGTWKTANGGVFMATSTGGQITGFGSGQMDDFQNGNGFCGCTLIDDPLKPEDALSDTVREGINDRWHTTIKSRFNSPRTPCIVIMQRIHEHDFCAMLQEQNEFDFKVLKLPAILDEGLETERPLWEAKHKMVTLREMRRANPYVFAGQYQQNPKPLGGGILKGSWFGRYERLPRIMWRCIFVDTAQKEKESNDYQVAECWGLGRDGNLYLIDMFRERFQAYELKQRMSDFWVKQKADTSNPLRCMYVEDKASGTQLIQDISRQTSPRIPIKGIPRSRSKLERVMDVQSYIQAGYVYLPKEASFVSDFIFECEAFTANDSHAHDDQIDPMCDAITEMLAGKTVPYSSIL